MLTNILPINTKRSQYFRIVSSLRERLINQQDSHFYADSPVFSVAMGGNGDIGDRSVIRR